MIIHQLGQPVFLSSLCRELSDIRQELYTKVNSTPGLPHLYVDEIDDPKSADQLDDHLGSIFGLVEKISRSEMIIIIAAQTADNRKYDHGSLIIDSEVSFWEIELYHAALREIPVYLIIEKGLSLSKQKLLTAVLRILPRITGNILEVERDKIVSAAFDIVVTHAAGNLPSFNQLLSSFQSIRSAPLDPRYQMFDRGTSSMQFASLSFANPHYNQSLVRKCLADAQKLKHYEKRISLLYIAFKELLKQGWWFDGVDTSILEDWAAVSSALSDDLRWYGAHGHLKLGVIWHTLDYGSAIRTLQDRGVDLTGKNNYSHYSALASEYYSLYKYIGQPNLKKSYQNIAWGLEAGYGDLDRNRLLAIRGSCYITDSTFFAAVRDFKEVISYSEKSNLDVNEIAHSYTKLGISYFGSGRFAKGYSYAVDSLKMFTEDNADKVRSLRILMKLYAVTFQWKKREACRQEALQISTDIGAFDQVRKLKKTGKRGI